MFSGSTQVNTTRLLFYCSYAIVLLSMAIKEWKPRKSDNAHHEPQSEGLLDRKAWHEAVGPEVEEALETGSPLCALILDLNEFKGVNDTFGHQAGDLVIDFVTDMVMKLRADDIKSGRIGGDEFAALCKTDEAGAQLIVDRIRQEWDEYINVPENKHLREEVGIGLAIGVGVLDIDPNSPLTPAKRQSQMLKDADEGMYRDKRAQLPEFSEHQEKAMRAAEEILRLAGVRLRFFVKYAQAMAEAPKGEAQEILEKAKLTSDKRLAQQASDQIKIE